jgi:N-acetylglucosaminyldiphosphoundecaprenol N-acetyl-beta-D-mannosaminyltransferase
MTQTSGEVQSQRSPRPRIDFLGTPVDYLSMEEVVARIQDFIASQSPHLVVACNVPKLWRMNRDARLKRLVESADMILPERIVFLSSRLCGNPLKAYIGNDRLTQAFLPVAAQRRYRVYFLGTRRSSLDRMLARLREEHPGLVVAGCHHGFFDEREAEEVAERIRRSQADVLFVGMGTPRQEYWMDSYGRELGVSVVIGVGGTLDVLAGLKRECPDLIRVLGMEWIYRAVEAPRDKLTRYSMALPWFVSALLVKGLIPRWLGSHNVAEN